MRSQIKNLINKIEFNENTINTIIGALVLVIVVGVIFNYYSNEQSDQTPEPEITQTNQTDRDQIAHGMTSSAATSRYEVTANDSLWSIAQDAYGDGHYWVEIAHANNLSNPNLIETGMLLDLPRVEMVDSTFLAADITDEAHANQTVSESVAGAQTEVHTVQPSDSLWNIAVQVYNDGYQWVQIWEANRDQITNPDILITGTELTIPR